MKCITEIKLEIISYFLFSMSNVTNYRMLLILTSISTMKFIDFNWAEKTTTIITYEQNSLVQLAGQSNKDHKFNLYKQEYL